MDDLRLASAEWRKRPGLDRLAEVLGAGQARFVGGAVRDTLLGSAVADVDIATRHAPTAVMDILKAAGIKAVPTGLAHGTITAVLESGPVEVTTLRRDVSTDGRHAEVAFTDDWREDAARRDFTINALYADPLDGRIFDYFDGIADLAAKRIRFIGDPFKRIAEDHLRILRFFRFLARFGDEPDAAALDACTSRAKDLMALSRERIADELLKLLVASAAVPTVRLMIAGGIFVPVLPEITDAARLEALAARESAADIPPDPIRRLAALLPRDTTIADQVGARLKLSKVQRKRLTSATVEAQGEPRPLAYRVGVDSALDRLLLSEVPVSDILALRNWQVPAFPLTGGALVARGITAGPEVARLLRVVEEQWVAEGFPDRVRAEQLADAVVAQTRGAQSKS